MKIRRLLCALMTGILLLGTGPAACRGEAEDGAVTEGITVSHRTEPFDPWDFEEGKLLQSNGRKGSSAATVRLGGRQYKPLCIRTKTFLAPGILSISAEEGWYFYLVAYDYSGAWAGTVNSAGKLMTDDFSDCCYRALDLTKLPASYQYKLVAFQISKSQTDISTADATHFSYTKKYTVLDDLYPYTSASIFSTIGVIGDSFCCGSIFPPDGSEHVTNPDVSWPMILGRQTGASVTCYARGGLTTADWLGNTNNGLPRLLADTPKQLYLICMGINDYQRIEEGKQSTGTATDAMKADSETFCGCYGQIVRAVQAHAPRAKIICVSIFRQKERALDPVIAEIAGTLGLPFLQVTDDPFFTSPVYYGSMHKGHPLAYGLGGMAAAMERLIVQCILENTDYFSDFTGAALEKAGRNARAAV